MKKALVLFLILALCLSFSGCKKGEEKPAETKKKVEEKEEEDEPEEVEENLPANQNLLTGVADLSEGAIGKRPVAVMVNNIPAAMPQYGVAKADIIFEIPVEGDDKILWLYTLTILLYQGYVQSGAAAVIFRRFHRGLMHFM